jgi:hypothetical protein
VYFSFVKKSVSGIIVAVEWFVFPFGKRLSTSLKRDKTDRAALSVGLARFFIENLHLRQL